MPTWLFVLPWSPLHPGGVNQVVVNLARELQKGNVVRPMILVADWYSPTPVWREELGFRTLYWRIRPPYAGRALSKRLLDKVWRRRFAGEFARFCDLHDVCAMNVHYPGPTTAVLQEVVARLRRPVPFVVSFHGSDLTNAIKASDPERSRLRAALDGASATVAVSQDLAERVASNFTLTRPVTPIHNGVDAETILNQSDTQLSMLLPANFIVSVAKFDDKKGLDLLIVAFENLAADFPDLALVMVGATSDALTRLREQVAASRFRDRITMLCDLPHPQVGAVLRRARLFVQPSRQEAFGIAILEAGLFAIPVIATKVGGIPEVITDGVSGRLIEPNNWQALCEAMRHALTNRPGYAQMGANLKSHVERNFSWRAAAARYLELTGAKRPI